MTLLALIIVASAASVIPARASKTVYPASCAGLPYQEVTIKGKKHRLYWTVDDHPNKATPRVLKIFKREKIKATFFLVTTTIRTYYFNPKWKPAIRLMSYIRAILKDGHSVGNHSVTHAFLCKKSRKWVRWEVRKSQKLIKKLTGITPKHWRPPHGVRCRWTRRAAKRYKLLTVMWHVDDWRKSPKKMWYYVLRRVRRGFLYTIVLLHRDTKKLERFLKYIKSAAPTPKPAVKSK